MAIIPQQDDEEDKVLIAGQDPSIASNTGQAEVIRSTGPSGAVVATPGAETSAGRQPSRSGGITNYQRYIDALRPQSQQMARNITGQNVDAASQRFGERVGGAQSSFTSKVGDAPKYDTKLVGEAINNSARFATNVGDSQRLEALRTAKYEGPSSFSDTGQRQLLEQNIQKEIAAGNELDTPGGREAFLTNIPGYNATPGMRKLDQFLLQATPEARAEFEGYGGQVQSRLDEQLNKASDIAKRTAEARRAATEQVQRRTQEALTSGVQNLGTSSESDIKQRTAALRNQILTNPNLTVDQLASAGITPEDYQLYQQGRAAAEEGNYGAAFGTSNLTPQQIVEGYASNFTGGNRNPNAFWRGLGNRQPTTREEALSFLRTNQGQRYNDLRGRLGYRDFSGVDPSRVNVAGQQLDINPYLKDGSVGATSDQVAQYAALQQLAGGGDATLSGAQQMFDARSAGARGSSIDAQQRQQLAEEQSRRADALNALLQNNQPAPVTRFRHTGLYGAS